MAVCTAAMQSVAIQLVTLDHSSAVTCEVG